MVKWLGVKIQSTHFQCFLNMPKFTRFLGGPNGPKICARRTKTDFKERACNIPECERKVFSLNFTFVLSSFGCSNLMGNVDCICSWKAKKRWIAFLRNLFFCRFEQMQSTNPIVLEQPKGNKTKVKLGEKTLARMLSECSQNVDRM